MMADPVTLGIVALGVSLMGTGMSAFGQYQQGQAQAAASEYNAAATEEKGKYEESQARDRLRRLLGTQRALYAKAGVDITSGSPLLVMADTAAQGEQEALNIRRGYQTEAGIDRFYGKQYKKAGMIGAGSTFLSGLGKAGTEYASWKRG
jgi:hypothetical protein